MKTPESGGMSRIIMSRTCPACDGSGNVPAGKVGKIGQPLELAVDVIGACQHCSGTGVECWACPIEEFMQLIAQRFSIRYPVMPPKEA